MLKNKFALMALFAALLALAAAQDLPSCDATGKDPEGGNCSDDGGFSNPIIKRDPRRVGGNNNAALARQQQQAALAARARQQQQQAALAARARQQQQLRNGGAAGLNNGAAGKKNGAANKGKKLARGGRRRGGKKNGNAGNNAGNAGNAAGNAGNGAGANLGGGAGANLGGGAGANLGGGAAAGGAVGKIGDIANQARFCGLVGLSNAIADGTQKKTQTCSQTIQGAIPDFTRMVSSIITQPQNGATVAANTDLQVAVSTQNMNLGFFEDPNTRYYASPQTLDASGRIEGHQHVVVQALGNGQTPLNPQTQALTFFKGLDQSDQGGVLTTTVPAAKLTVPGPYRICTITGTRGHQPVIMPVAQRGSQDDCIRINVA
ncbi:hypothetical protein RI367_007169 [Sorochytrium milnesiophthora]